MITVTNVSLNFSGRNLFSGEMSIDPNRRMSALRRDCFAYDEYTVPDTIITGNRQLYDIQMKKEGKV